jgi:hypothetical protein
MEERRKNKKNKSGLQDEVQPDNEEGGAAKPDIILGGENNLVRNSIRGWKYRETGYNFGRGE